MRRKREVKDRRRVLIVPTKRAMDRVWPLFKGIVETSSAVLSRFTISELETILRFAETNRLALREQLARPGQR